VSDPIRVLVADDQALVREGLMTLLQVAPGIVPVAAAADGEEAVVLATRHRPHVVLMDLRMPRLDGVEATRRIRAAQPETEIVVLTTHADDQSILGALQAGARGTYYAAMGLMNSDEGLFTSDDVRHLMEDGHDLQCHSFGHVSAHRNSMAEYREDVERGKRAIAAVRPDHRCEHFAYPYGHVTWVAKKELAQIFTSCRVTSGGLNAPAADLNLLRANQLYSDSVPLEAVRQLIAHARSLGGWLIFYTHDVRSAPSRFGCTPQYFEDAVRLTKDSGATIMTVSEAVALLRSAN